MLLRAAISISVLFPGLLSVSTSLVRDILESFAPSKAVLLVQEAAWKILTIGNLALHAHASRGVS